jgi:hypothetical protein
MTTTPTTTPTTTAATTTTTAAPAGCPAPLTPGAVPVELPEPWGTDRAVLAGLLAAMAGESARLQRLFSAAGPDEDRLAALAAAEASGDRTTLWAVAVEEVCAAHRALALAGARAADAGEDDTFAALAAACGHLMGWLTWCSRLPFCAPAALPEGEPVLAYRYATRNGAPARLAAVAFTEVLAARRWPPARRGDGDDGGRRRR